MKKNGVWEETDLSINGYVLENIVEKHLKEKKTTTKHWDGWQWWYFPVRYLCAPRAALDEDSGLMFRLRCLTRVRGWEAGKPGDGKAGRSTNLLKPVSLSLSVS